MVGSVCALNSAIALRRVFVPSSLESSKCLHVARILVPVYLASPQHQQARALSGLEFLLSSKSAGTWGSKSFKKAPTTIPKAPRPQAPVDVHAPGPRVKTKLARLPRDEEIRFSHVYVQEIGADGVAQLSRAQSLARLLGKLNRDTHSLQVIIEPDPEDPNSPQWPIARIMNKKEELAQKLKRQQDEKKTAASSKEKELELNWAMAPHDIDHKLQSLQKFLAKGWKVQILLMGKGKKGVKASKKQAQELLDKIVEAVAAVTGSKEWKGREGEVLGSMRIFLQGKLQQTEDVAKDRPLTKKEKQEMKKKEYEMRQKGQNAE